MHGDRKNFEGRGVIYFSGCLDHWNTVIQVQGNSGWVGVGVGEAVALWGKKFIKVPLHKNISLLLHK